MTAYEYVAMVARMKTNGEIPDACWEGDDSTETLESLILTAREIDALRPLVTHHRESGPSDNCAKCGTALNGREVTVDISATGGEWLYCSPQCMESH